MTKDYGTVSYTHVRRNDRAVQDSKWIKALLRQAAFGTLATNYQDQPFINSNLFVYDEPGNIIYLHTASVGRTRANVEKNERVCFSVSQMGRLLPADVALEFSVEYAGVAVFGYAQIVSDAAEAKHGLQLLLDKYAPHLRPGRDYRPITSGELKRTTVYRIEIHEWSGKKKEVAAEFPGAYYYQEPEVRRFFERRRDGFLISSDPNILDRALVYDFLANEAYWSRGITKEKVAKALRNSLCFGVYAVETDGEPQVGFARVITDYATFAYLADVFILRAYRGQGLGKWLVHNIQNHPELQGLRRWTLYTKDAHDFYAQFGYLPEPGPENHMVFQPVDYS
jgi:nitroimidazol reductase NimA-like FMN-containing flavoprotein (pyridoxamine 5'-phosphate oxidase superfamily)/predicted N-acetyltransferase YhbS